MGQARNNAASSGKQAPPKKKGGALRSALDFLAGPELEEGGVQGAELPGAFAFFRKRWGGPGNSGEAKEGFFRRYRRLHREYQEAKRRHVGNARTYEAIAQAARLSKEFLALLFASCLIATFGLFAGSTATIIGAMLVAPLMMPILGFALATIWGDIRLLWRSLATLVMGTVLVLLVSAVLAAAVPGVEVTSEIQARTNPSLFDILIAVASGLIGGYAFVNPRISASIAGVAIAVALMPPLCVVGIGIGLGDSRLAIGALLLYSSNLIGISLAASFVFWRLRVHPPLATEQEVGSRARRNVIATAVLLVAIAVPLGYFMQRTLELKRQQTQVHEVVIEELPGSEILSLDVRRSERGHRVKAILIVTPDTDGLRVQSAHDRIERIFPGGVQINLITLRADAAAAPSETRARAASR